LKKLGYQLATGELGINLSAKHKRGADLAIYKAENWKWEAKFSGLPPEVVIEIDTQAEPEEMTEVEYVSQKIKDFLAFGLRKIIWIFTKGKLVFIATSKFPWLTYDWDAEIEVVEGVSFKVNDVVKAI
jgi:Uma2 family endonuclease